MKLDKAAAVATAMKKTTAQIRWSDQQNEFFDALINTNQNVVLVARAGTGKTTTAIEGGKRLVSETAVRSLLYLAFNKSIAKELGTKLGNAGDARTFHSLGLRACKAGLGNVTVDGDKTRKIMSDCLDKTFFGYHSRIAQAVGFAKNANLFRPDDPEETDRLLLNYVEINGLDDEKMSPEKLRDGIYTVLERSLETTDVVDFDDMVWFPMMFGLSVPGKADVVIGDEAQDMNPGQLYLALNAGRRVILVGDDRQAIYAWRGAGYGVLRQMTDKLGAVELPLTTTYRCGKRIVESVQTIVPDYRAHESNGDGTVEYTDVTKCVAQAKPGDFVLSRTNAALLDVALEIGVTGVPVIIAGGIDKQIKALIKKSKAKDLDVFRTWLDMYDHKRRERLGDNEEAVKQHTDLVYCCQRLAEVADDIDHMIHMVDKMFGGDGGREHAVYCSTAHRAKGLEANTVWMLGNFKKDGHIGEQNVYYVAATRAIKRLIHVSLDNK